MFTLNDMFPRSPHTRVWPPPNQSNRWQGCPSQGTIAHSHANIGTARVPTSGNGKPGSKCK